MGFCRSHNLAICFSPGMMGEAYTLPLTCVMYPMSVCPISHRVADNDLLGSFHLGMGSPDFWGLASQLLNGETVASVSLTDGKTGSIGVVTTFPGGLEELRATFAKSPIRRWSIGLVF